jgi:hypothetical protein
VSGQHHAPAALYSRGKSPVPVVQEVGWAPEPVWTQGVEEKSSASVGDRTPVTLSVVSHCNNGRLHQPFIDFKKAYNSVRRDLLYSILTEFGIPRKLVGLIKMCLNETYSAVHLGKNISDTCPVQND